MSLTASRERNGPRDWYLLVLGLLLVGYALSGRGFAYLGIGPVYVGEICLLLGVVVLLIGKFWHIFYLQPVAIPAVLLVLWCTANTVPYISGYGLNSLRDAAIYYYSLFGWIIFAIIYGRPSRLGGILRSYKWFVFWFPPAIPIILYVMLMTRLGEIEIAPGVRLVGPRTGELFVHLSGCMAYITVRLGSTGIIVPALIAADAAALSALSRGGFVAFVVSYLFVCIFRRPDFRFVVVGVAALLGVLVFISLDIEVDLGGRTITSDQIVKNVLSIVGAGDQGERQEDTKEWRLAWWNAIIDDVAFGDYFWTGEGFGPNLANNYGIAQDPNAPELRSPHNGHLTFLARAGVPGLILWVATIVTWVGAMLSCMHRARRMKLFRTEGTALFLTAYAIAALVNATFDVYLEGPMGGILFWLIYGTGVALCALFKRDAQFLERSLGGKSTTVP